MLRATLAAALLTGALAAAEAGSVLETVERAAELTLNQIELPVTAAGFVRFKPCGDCPAETFPLAADTRFLRRGREIPFEEFSALANDIRAGGGADGTLVGVFVDRERGHVTKIAL